MHNLKSIPGFEGLYSINRYGDIYSHKRSNYLVSRLKNGYLRVILTKDNKRKPYLVSRLVSAVFSNLDLKDPSTEVHHKFGRQMNYPEELETMNQRDHHNWHKQNRRPQWEKR